MRCPIDFVEFFVVVLYRVIQAMRITRRARVVRERLSIRWRKDVAGRTNSNSMVQAKRVVRRSLGAASVKRRIHNHARSSSACRFSATMALNRSMSASVRNHEPK